MFIYLFWTAIECLCIQGGYGSEYSNKPGKSCQPFWSWALVPSYKNSVFLFFFLSYVYEYFVCMSICVPCLRRGH